MVHTKLFKNRDSHAVRIPSEPTYSRRDIELVIKRQGDELRNSDNGLAEIQRDRL